MWKIICLIFVLNLFNLSAQKVSISIYNDFNLTSVVVSLDEGSYKVYGDKSYQFTLDKNFIIYVTRTGDSVSIRDSKGHSNIFSQILFRGIDNVNSFKVRPVNPLLDERKYDDELEIRIDLNRLLILNWVDIDHYIAGVVGTEGGSKASVEYYKTQSIITRTYTFNHINRHIEEGFNLCDGVHCQAYKGRSKLNSLIFRGTKQTSGLVITDKNKNLITAAFHANCGGETANSEDVWLLYKPYLRAVKDPYCLDARNSRWQMTITLQKWSNYLKKNDFPVSGFEPGLFAFDQNTRMKNYIWMNKAITFKKIRDDWELRSSFFSVEVKGDKIVLIGKGYGHGVGLCQEGAMEMALQGKTYNEIINFYYQDVNILNIKQLNIPEERELLSNPFDGI
jgi:stage II sporulation protein D